MIINHKKKGPRQNKKHCMGHHPPLLSYTFMQERMAIKTCEEMIRRTRK